MDQPLPPKRHGEKSVLHRRDRPTGEDLPGPKVPVKPFKTTPFVVPHGWLSWFITLTFWCVMH